VVTFLIGTKHYELDAEAAICLEATLRRTFGGEQGPARFAGLLLSNVIAHDVQVGSSPTPIELANRHVRALDIVLTGRAPESVGLGRLADGCREHLLRHV
jgi:hypothetical protein